jgi:acyl-CoA reductase-like NAD-dependent aldehyde dehydrogenase
VSRFWPDFFKLQQIVKVNNTRSVGWAKAAEYGIVGINEGIISTEIAPFGGIKESGPSGGSLELGI